MRAEAEANHDAVKAERAFRRMLDEAKTLDVTALELVARGRDADDPGKSTRVLDQQVGHGSGPIELPPQLANLPADKLREALEGTIQRGERVVRSLLGSDAKTITEALRRLQTQAGPLAVVDHANLSQLLRLAEALVTLVEGNRDAQASHKTLPASLRGELESRLGADLGELRIHDDSDSAALADRHDAVAFARGTDVYFASGKYDPSSAAGKALIAHEATHVVQQRSGGAAASGAMSAPGSAVEREADRVANAFAMGLAPGAAEFAVSERAAAGTISRKDAAAAPEGTVAATPAAPKEWKLQLLGQVLDLSAKLAGATDIGGGQKQITINQNLGPLKIESAKYTVNGDKIESGTLTASIDSGTFKGTSGSLTVNSSGQVSGTLDVPLNIPGLLVKNITLTIGSGNISGTATIGAQDFQGPDFRVTTSAMQLTVTSTGGSISAALAGTAEVSIDNGIAAGSAKMTVDLHADSSGVKFTATISGKIDISGIAQADAVMTYDGHTVAITAGASVPVNLPGLQGTAQISYDKGKLAVQSQDLHFTLPQLAPIKFDDVKADQSKLQAKLHLASPLAIPIPGPATITLDQSTISIDGTTVTGDLTGTFKLNNAEGLTAQVKLAYAAGDITGSINVSGGAKFTVGGVEVSLDSASTLSVAKGLGVNGDIAGSVKINGLPAIQAHVIAVAGQPIDLTCSSDIPLEQINAQLTGSLHVEYHRGGGANAFSFEATGIGVKAAPVNGQVLFSTFKGKLEGKELTGELTAQAGTVIQSGGTSVTIQGGTIHLLPGRVLDGHLTARTDVSGSSATAKVGWTNGKFDWEADAMVDLGSLSNGKVIGQIHMTANSVGGGSFESTGEGITFGDPRLAGIQITHIAGNKQPLSFDVKIKADQAVTKLATKLPDVTFTAKTADASLRYENGQFSGAAALEGHAVYPKGGPTQLEGDFHASFGETGFTGKIDNIVLAASTHFTSQGGSIDVETGIAQIGTAQFSVPNVMHGTGTADINVKQKKFHFDVTATADNPMLAGMQIHVVADNGHFTASMVAGTPPIPLGNFATMTVNPGTQFSMNDQGAITGDLSGTLAAPSLGTGTFTYHLANGQSTGTATLDTQPFAIFDATHIALTIDANRKVSTADEVVLHLAPQYSTFVDVLATVGVHDNKFEVTGKVTKLKNLGKISEAFHAADLNWNQDTKQLSVHADILLQPVIPELGAGSTLAFSYANNAFALQGTMTPASYGPVTFTAGSHITASWTSSTNQFVVDGTASADIADIGGADFTVDAAKSRTTPGSFSLKGKINPTKLATTFPGITFTNVVSDFAVDIGGGQRPDLEFHFGAAVSAVPAAGISNMQAQVDATYHSQQGLSGSLTITQAKVGDVTVDGALTLANNKFQAGSLHTTANFPGIKVEGTVTVAAADMHALSATGELKVTPGAGSPLSQFVQSGNVHVALTNWKLSQVEGEINLKPPTFLPLEDTIVKIGYAPGVGINATLSTHFAAPMAKNGEKGTFTAGYQSGRGLYAHVDFPITVPGFQAATVAGDLDGQGIHIVANLTPKDPRIVKQASLEVGYDFTTGLYIQGSITLKPTESLELVVGLRYDAKAGLQVLGITPNDHAATPEDHEVAHWHKDFPTVPLATVGVASLGLKFGLGVQAGYRMPRIAFKNPVLEGGLDALDQGGMPAFTFGGSIAMGAYIALSMSVQIAGEIQLLIASCSAGIGAEIAARLNLDLGADVNGRFAPNEGALLQIDPFVGASLDLVASLIATLHASICWFTIVDKKWTLASTNFAHIDLGQFHPFNPLGLQIGGPAGTHLTNGLQLRDDAFDQIKEGVKQGAVNAGNEEANEDAKKRVQPVLQAFKGASHQFEQLPSGWERGMTAAPVDFHSMFPVTDDQWNYYQDHADTAETIDPGDAPRTPTERLAKAVGVTGKKDPGGAGRLILAWRRAQIANKGVNPDTGINVVQEREQVQAHINAQYQAALLAAQEKQKQQDLEYAEHVKKQAADYAKAQQKHVETDTAQKTAHDQQVVKTQGEWNEAQQKKTTSAAHAKEEGVKVQATDGAKAPPPPAPPPPQAPPALAKPAPIPQLPKVPLPAPAEILPAVTMPALPSDPGVSVHAAASIPPQQQQVQPQSPGAKQAPTGNSPDPMPGSGSSAAQVGGGGGGAPSRGAAGPGGAPATSGATGAAPPPGPAVTAGPDGIISQQKTLDAKELSLKALDGGGTAGAKPGVLGKLGAAPTAGAPAPVTAATPASSNAPAAPGAAPAAGGEAGLDPTVQKVVDQGKTEELAYKQKLGQDEQTFSAKVGEEDKKTEAEAQKLDKEAEAEKQRKEREKADAAAKAAAAKAEEAKKAEAAKDGGKAGGKDAKDKDDKKKSKGPIGTRVAVSVLGESHTLYIDEATQVPMVASTPTPVTAKLEELGTAVNNAPAIRPLATTNVQAAKADAQPLAELVNKAKGDDAAADQAGSQVTAQQQKLAGPLKITWEWSKVATDPAVTGGSIENPLLHPYYPEFKQRVQHLSDAGHISVDPGPYAEQIWTKICKAVKAATPQLNDPAAYSNFARGWLNMKSPEFQKAISQFEAIGREMAKAGASGFARAKTFGFWSKDEGRSLAEAVSDLTLETSAIGGLMDGLPTLDGKKAGWDPEIWGGLSNAYATAVVPELLKGKKVNVCVGAGVAAGNIWEAIESEALAKGLKGTKLTLEGVCTNYAAAAKSKEKRRELDETKHTNGIKGCLFVGDRGGAVAAADAHFATLGQQPPTKPNVTPPGAGPGAATTATKTPDPTASASKPLPPGAPIGARVPMTVGKEGHTQYVDPSGKPMVASTPTPVTDKLAELQDKLNKLAPSDVQRNIALTEIRIAQGLESQVANLADTIKKGTATASATTDLDTKQRALATSVGKIWNIADPGMMDAAKAKEAVDSRVKDCLDISTPLATAWVGKSRADFEKEFIDADKLRHAAIEKYLTTAPDKAKMATVGGKDPIAVQKFDDINEEKHLDPAHANAKDTFYAKLNTAMLAPDYTDRTRTYEVMKKAAGYAYNLLGTKIPADRLSPHSARNHSIDKLYDIAKGVATTKSLIDAEITREMTAKNAGAKAIASAKAKEDLRRKAYRHILKTHGSPLSTIDRTQPISPFGTWYAPGEIVVNASAPPNQEFARMMTLGALQPEWYPNGTAVLKIDRSLSAGARVCYKPTAFDGLMSALWCARNMGADDYGVTGGGVGEFLEKNVPFSDVTSMTVVIPTDEFLADVERVATEVKAKTSDSSPTEELLRGNKPSVINTEKTGVKAMYNQIIDRSVEEANSPSPAPKAPGAVKVDSTVMPTKTAAAQHGVFDRVPNEQPRSARPPQGLTTAPAPGVQRPGEQTAKGGGQVNDGRTPQQTAAGATAKPEFGGQQDETVAQAADRLHPGSKRDSHFNPAEKVAFERELTTTLLGKAAMFDAQVNRVSAAILKYFRDRLSAGITAGLLDAHEKYVKDLASLTSQSKPGWWGAVQVAAKATEADLANLTRQSLTAGSIPQKMAVHQNFMSVIKTDFENNVAQAFVGVSAVVPWYVRQQTKMKGGQLDQAGVGVFEKPHAAERGRVNRTDGKAVSPAGPGIAARNEHGDAPTSGLPAGTDKQQVYRGLDVFTMDEAKDFCQRARLKINMPLAAGVSGSTAELINVAMTMGLAGPDLQKYAVAVLAYIGGGGNHSYHEIAVVLAAAGLGIDPDTYHGLEPLIGSDLFNELKAKHPDAFRENTAKPATPPGA